MSHPPQDTTPTLPDLARTLLGHLEQEAAALREATSVLENLHQALRGASIDKVRAACVQQESVQVRLDGLRRMRGDLLHSISHSLQAPPETVTVRTLAARLSGPLRRQLDEARELTLQLAQQLDRLNKRNAMLALHCLGFVQDCLAELCGEAAVARYSAAGKTVDAPRGSLLEVQG